MNHKHMLGFLATLACFVVGQGSASAIEPIDDAAPLYAPYYHNSTTYVASHTTITWPATSHHVISTSTDNDYLVAACAKGIVTQVRIDFTHANGDLDMKVYQPVGTYLGVSQGVDNYEQFNTAQYDRNIFVMRIYGWNGATNSYSVTVKCSDTTTP
ncbi:MAG: hypothetical protein JW940_37330 [Polyangiaceae bacterium]|nr:hypothetical protein [Polyangiaceae bacterium]